MTKSDAIRDLNTLKDFFERESGATPMCLEYAIEAIESMIKKSNRHYNDDITWCTAKCETDCFRKQKYIKDKTIPHSYSDFSKICIAYEPKGANDEQMD